MGELVLLVIAAAWAAVLIPPLLRNRIENRPNSSVTDFRRQLNKLQSTVPSRAGAPMRGMARPLAQSPLQRPAAGGRPGQQPAQLRRGAGGRSHGARSGAQVREREHAPRQRTPRRPDRRAASPPAARRPPPPVPGRAPCGHLGRLDPSSSLERVVHAGSHRCRHAVPRCDDAVGGHALRVRRCVPHPVRLRLHVVAGPPARVPVVAKRLDAALSR